MTCESVRTACSHTSRLGLITLTLEAPRQRLVIYILNYNTSDKALYYAILWKDQLLLHGTYTGIFTGEENTMLFAIIFVKKIMRYREFYSDKIIRYCFSMLTAYLLGNNGNCLYSHCKILFFHFTDFALCPTPSPD